MYKLILIVFLIVLAVPGTEAQDKVSGTRSVDAFHSISIASEIDAELLLSKEESVELELQGAESGQLITEVVDGVLKIRMKTGSYKDAILKVKINFKDIKSIEATGRAAVWSYEDLYTDNLEIKLFNGGATRLTLYCDTLTVNISQGSILSLKGEGYKAGIKVNTNATFNGYEFECQDVEVNATSTGKAKISASNSLKATASTGGFIGYVGNPKMVDRRASMKGEILKTELEE
jgi:hypothetical protein